MAFLALSVVLIAGGNLYADPITAEKFIDVQTGDLPFILSAPHGGSLDLPGAAPRKAVGLPTGSRAVVVTRDSGTDELLRATAARIKRQFGKRPYFVVSRVHRKYVDLNRLPEVAYDSEIAAPVYREYHSALNSACKDVFERFGKGLLLDFHGQGKSSDTVYRGTSNGVSVELLRQRFGDQAYTGKESLFGTLRAGGWRVFPDPMDGREHPEFSGGYIVRTYGSHQGTGIDAIQLEFGSQFRKPDNREQTANKLVDALSAYSARYLDIAAE